MHTPFETEAVQHYYSGAGTYTVPVIPHDSGTRHGVVMEIKCDHEYVYITKQQAMAFFNLKE
jgi:hypothetical protein